MTADKVINVGFSGPKAGMTELQKRTLFLCFDRFDKVQVIFHHGDCIGADQEACLIALQHNWWLHAHPGNLSQFRAYIPSHRVEVTQNNLTRNREIVSVSNIIFLCPGTFDEQLRSGTWSTIRYARSACRRRMLIWPDGKAKYEDA